MKRCILFSAFVIALCLLCACTPKHEHTYTAEITPKSCTEQGYTTYTCECGDCYVSDYVEPSHDWGEWIVVEESTPQQNGLMERYCSSCDAKESTDE